MNHIEAMKLALEALEETRNALAWFYDSYPQDVTAKGNELLPHVETVLTTLRQAIEQAQKQEPVTVLPDGSAFAVMSYPLPKDHWLYAEREYRDGEDEPAELGKPILTHQLRDSVVSAVRYAVRGATNCGKEVDFDPDALVQNAVYALCGPYGGVYTSPPQRQPLTDEEIDELSRTMVKGNKSVNWLCRAIEAAHGIKGEA
jgi:hypothetical protein